MSRAVRPSHRRRSWMRRALDSDDGRVWLAAAVALPVTAGLSLLLEGAWAPGAGLGGLRRMLYVNAGLALVLMYACYLALTLRRYRGLDSRALERTLRTVSRGARRDGWAVRWGLAYGSTLGWTTSVSVIALVLVIVVMLDPLTRGDVALHVLCAAVVASSWAVLLVSQALAYARIAAQHGGIAFTGTPDPTFTDFLSLATFVSAMFGTGDAVVTGRRTRTAMREHVLVGFAFNSMLLASLATLLLGSG